MSLVDAIARDPVVTRLVEACGSRRRVFARGSAGSSAVFVAGALTRASGRPVVLVVAHLDDADEAADELAGAGIDVSVLPAMEVMPGETGLSLELFAQRLQVVREAMEAAGSGAGSSGRVVVCPMASLMQAVPGAARLSSLCRQVRVGERVDPGELVRWLDGAGYRRVDAIEEVGDFAVRGGIIDVFPPSDPARTDADGAASSSRGTGGSAGSGGTPVRLDFFGDEVEKINEIDIETMGSDRAVDAVELVCASVERARGALEGDSGVSFLDLLSPTTIAVLHEPMEIVEQARGYYERVLDASGIFGPPAVLKRIGERFENVVEISQFSGATAASDAVMELPVSLLPTFAEEPGAAIGELVAMRDAGRVCVHCQTAGELQRLGELLHEHDTRAEEGGDARNGRRAADVVETVHAYVHRGFVWRGDGRDGAGIAVVAYQELVHRFETRRRARGAARLRAGRSIDTFLDFAPGDYVVHRDHGIAVFRGLTTMASRVPRRTEAPEIAPAKGKKKSDGPTEEFLTLEFAKGAKLHVPAAKIDLVQKYIGGFRGKPPLSVVGGAKWRTQKERVSESVKDLAAELLRVRAARELSAGIRYPGDTTWQKEFEGSFPYRETEDQLAAIAEIKRDMQDPKPMDRLLCGDVGFGKTELAIRAAFKACEFGKQVAVLVPTTVLAEQHERTFRGRFADYPFRVESLSRFKTNKEVNDTLAALRRGQVDIIIGTHRLLSKDVKFADLGLVVIDEEQRFGVEHKERLLALRLTADILTLSATPIPRTLHMSMLGLRDISSLSTPPADRRAVVTEVIPRNEQRIVRAISRELSREGQVYFVHNRVHNIQSVADDLLRLIQAAGGDARIVVGHGQMADRELERVMLAFMRREADILVSTTIIESGIDIPSANTIFICDADRFGLADLHQLRGRVGRYKDRAYCYLLLPNDRPVTEKAVHRLKAIEEFSMLGAGFKIAMRDLEIRGAGNILGPEQSGHIAAVGYEMYCQLLDRAVKELRNEVATAPSETSIEIGATGHIPKPYIPSDQRRMDAYRRIAVARSGEELAKVRRDLTNAYGSVPTPVETLMGLAELRIGANELGIRTITIREKDVLLRTGEPGPVESRLTGAKGTVRVLAPKAGEALFEVYFRPPESFFEPETLLTVLRRRLGIDALRETIAAAAAEGDRVAGAGSSETTAVTDTPEQPGPGRGRR